MKRTVLITGATSGIGLALAKKFAGEKDYLVLVSSSEKRLRKVASTLAEAEPGCRVTTICQDLSVPGAAETIYKKVKEQRCKVDILINNAGIGMIGEAVANDGKKEEALLYINALAMTRLCELFLQDMYRRKRGKVLNVASVGAFQPGPYTAVYYASKAYVASYSRAIRYEAAKHGVAVCTLYPGTTRTEFFERAGEKTPFYAMSADKVAACAVEGLMKNKEMIVPGLLNRILRLVPVRIKLFGVAMLKK